MIESITPHSSSVDSKHLHLSFGFSFDDLYRQAGLARLDAVFLEQLKTTDVALLQKLTSARANPAALSRKEESDLIVELAPHVEDFIGELFAISGDIRKLMMHHDASAALH